MRSGYRRRLARTREPGRSARYHRGVTDVPLPGADWEVGPDGMPWRQAARVLLLDADFRILLVQAHDAHEPERTWWFTVGGGIDAGETPRDTALREVAEETGLRLDPADLVGPVASRSATFDFFARHVRQDEVFFLARLERPSGEFDTSGWTDVERAFLDGFGWFSVDDLEALDVEVFPPELPALLTELRDGWDGVLRVLPDQWD